MADGTQLNAGTGGDLISTDDLGGGVKVQRIKVQFGVDGAASDVAPANPLPARVSSDGTNPVDATHPLHVRNSADGTNPVDATHPLPTRGGDGTTQAIYTTAGEALATPKRSATGTTSRVSNSASSVTVLASNAARLGAVIVNDTTTVTLYLKCGTTATTTDYTYQMQPGDTVELPFGYTGRIDGIASSASGAAQITEFT